MDSSDKSLIETPSDNDSSQDISEDSSREYSEGSVLLLNEEFGPENSHSIAHEDGLEPSELSLPWVPTFKDRVDKVISRLLNDSMKFCTSGKLNAPPIISISLLKVAT